jgi:hypothetical protein
MKTLVQQSVRAFVDTRTGASVDAFRGGVYRLQRTIDVDAIL